MNIDEVVQIYHKTDSIKATAREIGVSHSTVRKALISAGLLPTEKSKTIDSLLKSGATVEQISKQFAISIQAVRGYLAYKRTPYFTDEKSKTALKISNWRKSKQ